ncbi:hypothetical protein [Pseudarthrobacter sp. MM222]|uniref:hypothetical protein n=1 Tax=Pseudarthrobacter sp. MM222 TaxID=3018929 RepID=UPI00221F051B|nr:hypothetical protein [Pseudarthrobacter sp. MM222]
MNSRSRNPAAPHKHRGVGRKARVHGGDRGRAEANVRQEFRFGEQKSASDSV